MNRPKNKSMSLGITLIASGPNSGKLLKEIGDYLVEQCKSVPVVVVRDSHTKEVADA